MRSYIADQRQHRQHRHSPLRFPLLPLVLHSSIAQSNKGGKERGEKSSFSSWLLPLLLFNRAFHSSVSLLVFYTTDVHTVDFTSTLVLRNQTRGKKNAASFFPAGFFPFFSSIALSVSLLVFYTTDVHTVDFTSTLSFTAKFDRKHNG